MILSSQILDYLPPRQTLSWGVAQHRELNTGLTILKLNVPHFLSVMSLGGSVGAFNLEQYELKWNPISVLGFCGGSLEGLGCFRKMANALNLPEQECFGAVVHDLWNLKPSEKYPAEFLISQALQNLNPQKLLSGNHGVGAGTCSGKFVYLNQGRSVGATKTGVGIAYREFQNSNEHVGFAAALTVVNAVGNVVRGDSREILAGNRGESGDRFLEFEALYSPSLNSGSGDSNSRGHTTLSLILTNLDLRQLNLQEILRHSSHGQIRAIRPVHTACDGDLVAILSDFSFSIEETKLQKDIRMGAEWPELHQDMIGNLFANLIESSIHSAATSAEKILFSQGYQGRI